MEPNPGRSEGRLLGLTLGVVGVIGCASLLLVPFELLLPPGLDIAPLTIRALSLVNPLILLIALVALGTWLAPRTGLDAPLVRAWLTDAPLAPVLKRQVIPALGVGIVVAVVLHLFALISTPWFAGTIAARFDIPLLPRLLYGGVTEELISRWGLMTFFVWCLMRLRLRGATPYVGGAIAAAALFAAGHLPMLAMLVATPSPTMIAAVVIGNFAPGLLFGLLYWKRGLESAMMAHAIAHLLAWLAMLLM